MSKGSEAETSLAEVVAGAHNVLCYSSSIDSTSRGGGPQIDQACYVSDSQAGKNHSSSAL